MTTPYDVMMPIPQQTMGMLATPDVVIASQQASGATVTLALAITS
jgi:hypothetical protein